MLTISKKGDYGLLFLTAIAKEDPQEYIPLSRVSKENGLPYKFLSQIAIELKKGGLIVSKEGLGGGYRLNRPPEQISVGDILDILEGPTAPVSCMRGKECKNIDVCQHKFVMEKLAVIVDDTLHSYALSDLVSK